MTTTASPRTRSVREGEYELLVVLRAALGGDGAEAAPLLRLHRPGARTVSPGGALAIKETHAVGLVRALAHGGGARREPWGGRPAARLWEHTPTPALVVTNASLDLLRWSLAESMVAADRAACPAGRAGTAGDLALGFLLARLFVRLGLRDALGEDVFATNPLVQLAFADALALATVAGEGARRAAAVTLELPPFLTEHGLLVRGFSAWLAAGVLGGDVAPTGMDEAIRVSAMRRAVYGAWLDACVKVGQLDLATPLADASVAALARPAPPALSGNTASARDRAAAARAGTVLPEVALRLADHVAELGRLDFFDDGYAEAQRLRQRWAGVERARGVAEGRVREVAGV